MFSEPTLSRPSLSVSKDCDWIARIISFIYDMEQSQSFCTQQLYRSVQGVVIKLVLWPAKVTIRCQYPNKYTTVAGDKDVIIWLW